MDLICHDTRCKSTNNSLFLHFQQHTDSICDVWSGALAKSDFPSKFKETFTSELAKHSTMEAINMFSRIIQTQAPLKVNQSSTPTSELLCDIEMRDAISSEINHVEVLSQIDSLTSNDECSMELLGLPMMSTKHTNQIFKECKEWQTEEEVLYDFDEQLEQIPILDMLMELNNVDEHILFEAKGYKRTRKICNTLQGFVIEAIQIKNANKPVLIKKCDKELCRRQISFADDNNIRFCVDDDIFKERMILKYLTIDNKFSGRHIFKYIDFFESDDAYYLVTESVYDLMNLQEFTQKAQQYIKEGKLKKIAWTKMVKYITWQIAAVLHWMHHDMHC